MDFTLTEEQRMLAEVVTKLLKDHTATANLRREMAANLPRNDTRWNAIVETGLVPVLVDIDAGGLGLSAVDFAIIAENCGRVLLPEPLVEHGGVVLPLLAELAPDHPLFGAALDGSATIAIAHPVMPFIADADTAAGLLLVDQGCLHLVPRDQVTLTRIASVDPLRRLFQVNWTPDPSTRIADATNSGAALDRALDRGALFAAAQCLGIAQRCVDIAVDYAGERTQFGKPVGSYQAVKHHLATAQVRIEFARPVIFNAACQLTRYNTQSRAAISHAKLVATEAADLAARTAIQVHGAMGFSWEVDVHFYLKRALVLTQAWGIPAFHTARVAERMLTLPLGPDQTFANEASHG